MDDGEVNGIALSRAFSGEIVEPMLAARFPGLPFSAGRLGSGSDVLGLDDAVSRDHDWGLRLSLFVPIEAVVAVDDELERGLPSTFRGLPVRFAFTGQEGPRHHVEVSSVTALIDTQLGFDPRAGASARDWLSLTGQVALEVVAGPLFAETSGELASVRRALEWYPDDLWHVVLAADWERIAQELPFVGRAAHAGDDAGSRLLAARVAHSVMHLAFLVERRWPPYSKWFGTVFRSLPCAADVAPGIDAALAAGDGADRQRGLTDALEAVNERQRALGLSTTTPATIPFWDRASIHPDPRIGDELRAGIVDDGVRRLPRGLGSVEQRTDNVDILVDLAARRSAVAD